MDPISRLNTALEGRYRIERELGEGGMATVYLADDLKHERKVALKVLKPELAAVVGAERFLAEIRTTANLQHPHILALYDSGEADGLLFYVMPYVKGESLRARLEREHQLPVDDAVRIATNLAEALDFAHRQGVIHRDIKPANVMLQDGKPVIADFGIALAVGAAGGGRLTETGLSLGTPHYMSPEQATGDQSVGPPTDIYALGCVLYEMLLGEPPFTGSTPQAVLGKIITGEVPSAKAERASVPPNVDAVIARALEKVPADRFSSGAELLRAVGDPGFRHGEKGAVAAGRVLPWKRLALATTASTAALALALLWSPTGSEPGLQQLGPLEMETDWIADNQSSGVGRDFDLGPWGTGIVYRGPGGQLWRRSWEDVEPTPIRATQGHISWYVSPDGRWVAFNWSSEALGQVFLVELPDGVRQAVPGATGGVRGVGNDGSVYFIRDRELFKAHPQDDTVHRIMSLEGDETNGSMVNLPGDDKALVVVRTPIGPRIIGVDLATGERKLVTSGGSARYTETGHLVFRREGSVFAASLDLGTLELGANIVELPIVVGAGYDLSSDGVLAYWTEGDPASYEFVWVDRQGIAEPVDPRFTFDPLTGSQGWSLSPDGSRIALRTRRGGNIDIWIKPLDGGAAFSLTSDTQNDFFPRWSRDGQVTYLPMEGGVWARSVTGAGRAELVFPPLGRDPLAEGFWGPHSDWLVLRTVGRDILAVRPASNSVPVSLVASDALEYSPALSPDGRWLAWVSEEVGSVPEVWVAPFPDVEGSERRISNGGGIKPIWTHGGEELFYMNPETRELVSVEIDTTTGFQVGDRTTLFTLPDTYVARRRSDFYDISPDDQRFLMVRVAVESTQKVRWVFNFHEELKRLVPN